MPLLRLLTQTARTASLLITPPDARFALPQAAPWQLTDAKGIVTEGMTDTAGVFLDELQPATAYEFRCLGERLSFRTGPCAGLVRADSFGLDSAARDNRGPLQAAIDAVPEGGTLMIPRGTYLTRPLFLKPRMTLHLADGCTLAAPSSRKGWPQLPATDVTGRALGTWEGMPSRCFAALLTALDCDQLSITGRGKLDGGGDRGDWWSWPKETREGARRPRVLHLAYGAGIAVSGITVCNAPSWTVHPYRCEDLSLTNMIIRNPPDSPNTDGLNPESCTRVEIAAVDFSVGDDCIAIKAGKRGPRGAEAHLAPCRTLHIHHCRMARGHGAVVLGSEMSGGIEDVRIEACLFDGTDRGLRIKTRRGRGGFVRDVSLSDVDMRNVATPLAVNAFYFCDPDGKDDWVQDRRPAPVVTGTPCISDIHLSNVTAHGVSVAAAALLGLPEAPITSVTLDHFHVTYDPAATPQVPLMALGQTPVSHAGLLAENADVDGAPEPLCQKDPVLCS